MEDTKQPQFITPEIEKRRHRRAKLVTEVKCDALGRDEILLTRDVSVGGTFVTTNTPLPLNSIVGLSFSVGTGAAAICCTGKVVFSKQGMGMGIEFADLKEEDSATLRKFLDESN